MRVMMDTCTDIPDPVQNIVRELVHYIIATAPQLRINLKES